MECSRNWHGNVTEKIEIDLFESFNTSSVFARMIRLSRMFFYVSDPAEESYEFVQQVPDLELDTFPLLILLVFLEWFVLWLKGKPLPFFGDSAASASMIVNMECFRIFTMGMEHSIYIFVYKNYRLIDLPWNSASTWYFAAILIDFSYYWGHRFAHEINALWSQHQAHHSAENFTIVNTFRMAITNDWLYMWGYIPLAVAVPPTHYLVHYQINLIYQVWVHNTLIGKLGPLEWIFNTPSHHRVHHGCNRSCIDKNFGGWLIIWDRMFGTFQEESEDEPIVYGLVESVHSFNPLYLQTFYIGKMYSKWKSMDGWKNKVFSVIKGPGWRPGSPRTGFIEEIPDVTGREMYTYPAFPVPFNIYIISSFFITLIPFRAVIFFKDIFDPFTVFIHLMFVVLSLTTIGMFYDRHPAAPYIEFVRCSFVFFYSLNGIPLITNTLNWSGLTDVYGCDLQFHTHFVVGSYFLISALAWGLVSLYQTNSKLKMN